MVSFLKNQPRGVYFVGIGGVSMSALAQLVYDSGILVRGCDARESIYTKKLRKLGIPVKIGSEQIYENTIVYTEAVDRHADLLEQLRLSGKQLYSRAEFLGKIAEEYPRVLSIAGCHGKTSATAMLAHILFGAGLSVTCHIGGEDIDFGNYRNTGHGYFLTEACEFKRSFLSLNSNIAVILNTELDHTDCYGSREELLTSYHLFAKQARRVIVNADDCEAQKIPHAVSFGLHAGDIRAERIVADRERYCFTVTEKGTPIVQVRLNTQGKVQIYNALAAYSAARLCGIAPRKIADGLAQFHGVKRRFEFAGTLHGVPVICDYAHHPTEIAAAFATAERICRGTVRVIFQPHTYSRTRDLMTEFVSILKNAENPVIYRTYAARESFDFRGSAVSLVSRIPEAIYCQTPDDLKRRILLLAQPEDLILVLGAGDIDDTIRSLLDQTSTDTPFCSQA